MSEGCIVLLFLYSVLKLCGVLFLIFIIGFTFQQPHKSYWRTAEGGE